LILPAELLGHQSSIIVVVDLSFPVVVLYWHHGSHIIVVLVGFVVAVIHLWFGTFTSEVTFLVTVEAAKLAFVVPHLAVTSTAPDVPTSSLSELLGTKHSHANMPRNIHLLHIIGMDLIKFAHHDSSRQFTIYHSFVTVASHYA